MYTDLHPQHTQAVYVHVEDTWHGETHRLS